MDRSVGGGFHRDLDRRDVNVKHRWTLALVSAACVACLASMAYAQPDTQGPPGQASADGAAAGPTRSIVEGQPAGIEVGDCAPDFELEPIEIHDDFERWLGDEAPQEFADKIMLSDLAGKAPIILLFGSYT